MKITAAEIGKLVNGVVLGDASRAVMRVAVLEDADADSVSFISNPKYLSQALNTKAAILIVPNNIEIPSKPACTFVKTDDPYTGLGKILAVLESQKSNPEGIEEPVYIHPSAKIGKSVYCGAFAYVGKYCNIGDNVQLHAGVYVGEGAVIGNNSILFPGVKVYRNCKIGNHCIIHAGTVIGSDGFGFAPQADGSYQKIPQTGNVVIEDNVEIGANTTIDRATIGSTIIRKGVKIDNLVQIAHNVEIGEHSALAAQSGISGSTRLGRFCLIGGQAGLVGHLTMADGTKINAQSGVSKSVKKKDSKLTGSPAFEYQKALRSQVIFKELPEIEKRLTIIESKIEEDNNRKLK